MLKDCAETLAANTEKSVIACERWCFMSILFSLCLCGSSQARQETDFPAEGYFQSNFWYLLQGLGALGQFILKVTTVLFNRNLSLWLCSLELLKLQLK